MRGTGTEHHGTSLGVCVDCVGIDRGFGFSGFCFSGSFDDESTTTTTDSLSGGWKNKSRKDDEITM